MSRHVGQVPSLGHYHRVGALEAYLFEQKPDRIGALVEPRLQAQQCDHPPLVSAGHRPHRRLLYLGDHPCELPIPGYAEVRTSKADNDRVRAVCR
ncbi:hypothetical protein [Nocardia sp. CA-120079]|uniref:hypothetical protein n=1 Tax=Nocardia sp. CA-120079 TaxID=3239974 RepID=UPI003D98BAA2